MSDYGSLLYDLKNYRRGFADQLEQDMDPETARRLGETHLAILAVEAIMAEPPVKKTGPIVEFDDKGWPAEPQF